jgi:uncharacterized membrane protein YhdT
MGELNGPNRATHMRLLLQIIGLVAILALPSFLYTGSYIISDAPAPKEGLEAPPYPDERLSEGLLFIVLDGAREDMMSDSEFMPLLNERVKDGAYINVKTNPLTMTASCVKEMATGIPSRPNEGLSNFHPEHPGTPDGWALASTYDGDGDGQPDNDVGIVGPYVWVDLYKENDLMNLMILRHEHADYMKGDIESFETLNSWLDGDIPESNTRDDVTFERTPNVIIAHLAGLDSIGHRYGTKDSPEYEEKLQWLDDEMAEVFAKVPENWTVVITTDHGLTDSGQHGSPADEIRNVGAFVWGPHIAKGVTVAEIDQRDLATLPSLLLSLPLPHAIHGEFPLDALDVTEEKKQVFNQWNWNATVERNQWMEDNEYPYVEGLSTEVIEWEKISSEDLGLRNSDLILSGSLFSMICIGIMYLLRKHGFDLRVTLGSGAVLATIFTISSYIAFNREQLVTIYYLLGMSAPLITVGLALYLLTHENGKRNKVLTSVFFSTFVVMLTNAETRFSTLGFMFLVMLLIPMFTKAKNDKRTSLMLKTAYVIVMIPTIFLSHYRGLGFSLPRMMIYFTFKGTLMSILFGSLLILIAIYIFVSRNDTIKKSSHRMGVVIGFASIPSLMYLENNFVDWILLLGIIGCILSGLVLTYKKSEQTYDLIPLAIFFWLGMSWGGWALAATLIMYASVESFLKKEWNVLTKKYDSIHREASRMVILTLLPLVTWFTWWAALGQIDGLGHPRDVDPGNIFLNGGYIGDRFSPSNAWVGAMGAGPIAAVSLLWWSLFHKHNWPVHYVALLLMTRVALLSLQLSLSPNLPRLIFKISWDILFAMMLLGMMTHVLISSSLKKRNLDTTELV